MKIEYKGIDPVRQEQGQTAHYTVTPYSFRPRIAKKLVSQSYVDMGQGIIDCLEEIQASLNDSAARFRT